MSTPDTLSTAALTADDRACATSSMLTLIRDLYPMCRSITGPGTRSTLARIGQRVPLRVTEVPTGTPVFDWQVPREWSIEDAYLEHESGRRFADFGRSNLHVVSYSTPVDTVMPLSALRERLHTLPHHPDWIPWRSSYYREDWGFCLAENERLAMPDGQYRVVIRSRLHEGALTYAEFVHPGETDEEVLVFAHTCHPSLCNDNLSGIAVATELASWLSRHRTRYTYRVLFAPATIGSITWLALNQVRLDRLRHGLVLAMLGDASTLKYHRTKHGRAEIDRAAACVLRGVATPGELLDFSPWGFDERQFNMPGFGLPVGRLTRALPGGYPEEHTSADTPDLIQPDSMQGAWLAVLRIVEALEGNRRHVNLAPHGEPQLGRRGLYRQSGGHYDNVPERHLALLWLLQLSDGEHSLLDIAERSGLDFGLLASCASDLQRAALLAPAPLAA